MAASHGLRHVMSFVLAMPVGWSILFALYATELVGLVVAASPFLRWGILTMGTGYSFCSASRLRQNSHLKQTDNAKLKVGFMHGVGLQFLNSNVWVPALVALTSRVAGPEKATARMRLPTFMAAKGCARNLTNAVTGFVQRCCLMRGRPLVMLNRCIPVTLGSRPFEF